MYKTKLNGRTVAVKLFTKKVDSRTLPYQELRTEVQTSCNANWHSISLWASLKLPSVCTKASFPLPFGQGAHSPVYLFHIIITLVRHVCAGVYTFFILSMLCHPCYVIDVNASMQQLDLDFFFIYGFDVYIVLLLVLTGFSAGSIDTSKRRQDDRCLPSTSLPCTRASPTEQHE